ncbi:hypothetical protein [Geotalea sp. SG265]|uniref:hypothetical protein n=1 Tax=Geotalea sp. SG265 TaxID=2922867 RepID=UPI001FB021C1|nr:hypothetical protein [Geotalea sp. SG265]
MKRLAWFLRHIVASRGATPAIIGCFALIYIIIAFYNDEALVTLLALTRSTPPLAMLLACIPLNLAARLFFEIADFIRKKRLTVFLPQETWAAGERVKLAGRMEADLLEKKLAGAGYHCRHGEGFIAAWKGISAFPARFFLLLGFLLLFSGILLSTTTRESVRTPLIEGEPLPEAMGAQGRVEQILLRDRPGLVLARTLAITVGFFDGSTETTKEFGLYPPGSLHGVYLYPRYLGLAPFVEFTPPERAFAFSSYVTLMIYPPGREDSVEVPGSPYRIAFTLAEPRSARDPYSSGKYELQFRVVKDKAAVAEGTVPLGSTVTRNGYTLAFPNAKRIVMTDLVRDRGLSFIWWSGLCMLVAVAVYMPVRLLAPRREMMFVAHGRGTQAISWAEGGKTAHRSVFHGILDAISRDQDR